MPIRIKRISPGKYRVSTPNGTKAKGTTKAKAKKQASLLNAIDHNPSFKPRKK